MPYLNPSIQESIGDFEELHAFLSIKSELSKGNFQDYLANGDEDDSEEVIIAGLATLLHHLPNGCC